MSRRGQFIAVVGFVAVVVGLAFVFAPDLALDLPGTGSTVIGLLALVQSARILLVQRDRAIEGAETPDPEVIESHPQPGHEFDAQLADARGRMRGSRYTKDGIRKRLEAAAVETLTWRQNYSTAEAERRLEEGTWSDDPYAVAFFVGGSADVPLRERLSHSLSRESRFQRQARHVVAVIDRLARPEEER